MDCCMCPFWVDNDIKPNPINQLFSSHILLGLFLLAQAGINTYSMLVKESPDGNLIC